MVVSRIDIDSLIVGPHHCLVDISYFLGIGDDFTIEGFIIPFFILLQSLGINFKETLNFRSKTKVKTSFTLNRL